MNVRTSLPCDSVLLTPLQECVAVMHICDCILALALHENTSMLILSYIQRFVLLSILEQVVQLLIVYLQE